MGYASTFIKGLAAIIAVADGLEAVIGGLSSNDTAFNILAASAATGVYVIIDSSQKDDIIKYLKNR